MAMQNKPQIEEVIEKSGNAELDEHIKELENAIEESIEAFNVSIRELSIGIKEIKNINLDDMDSDGVVNLPFAIGAAIGAALGTAATKANVLDNSVDTGDVKTSTKTSIDKVRCDVDDCFNLELKKAENQIQPEDYIQHISDLTICLPNKVHIVNNFKSTEVERTLSDYVSILQKISGLKKIVEKTILDTLDNILVNSNDYSKYNDADKKFVNDMLKMYIVFEVISKPLAKIATCEDISTDGEKISREIKREYMKLSLLASIIDDHKRHSDKFPLIVLGVDICNTPHEIYDDLKSLIVEFEKYAETHQYV